MKTSTLHGLWLAAFCGLIPLSLPAQVEKLPKETLDTLRKDLSRAEQSFPGAKNAVSRFHAIKDPAEKAMAESTFVRVAKDIETGKLKPENGFVFYSVPPMSDLQRLQYVYPVDGKFNSDVRVVLAKDEYEAGSFQIYPAQDMTLSFELNDLKSKSGTVLPKSDLDLKVVKIWMQNGNAWYSYFSDTALTPIPELLLKDENLIQVDYENKGNYARVKRNGQDVYQWISPERNISFTSKTRGRYGTPTPCFFPMKEDFSDKDTLQPVSMKAGEMKQMWLTVHASKEQQEGLYQGAITVRRDGRQVGSIPIAVRVLPFELPMAKSADLKRDFIISLYGGPSVERFYNQNGENRELAKKQLLSIYKNYKAHNLLNPLMEDREKTSFEENIKIRKEAGLPTNVIVGPACPYIYAKDSTGAYNAAERKRMQDFASDWAAFLKKTLGHTNSYLMNGDEPGADWVQDMRPIHKILHENNLKFFTAGHEGIFNKGGYQYDVIPLAHQPGEAKDLKGIKMVDHSYVGFYAVQHNGSENPTFVRRQHGLLGHSTGLNMIINYEFGFFGWNDLEYDLYKPMMLAYTSGNGLIDTMEWEAFREAVDDIRYMTLLKTEIERCKKSENLHTRYAARQALMWLSKINFSTIDLNALRLETIHYIMKLRALR